MPPHPPRPPRRVFVVSATGLLAGLAAPGLTACGASAGDRQLSLTSLAAAEAELLRLAQASTRESATTWNWAQTLVHCAQSIEFSMTGFPQARSALFQRTVGAVAFEVFSWRGRMSHDLAEPIPGAAAVDGALAPAQALARLRQAIATFRAWTGPLQPHFAYGALDKPAFERAHAMHLANHFSAFDAKA